MFERYTEKARRVIFFARYEASQFGSPFIETEHILLGVLREDKALAARLFASDPGSNPQEPRPSSPLELPPEVTGARKRIQSLVSGMEAAIAAHDFRKAREYSEQERRERENLRQLCQKHNIEDRGATDVAEDPIAADIRRRVESLRQPREKVSASIDLPLSHPSKRVLAYGAEESERLHQTVIGPEHLVLGLLREEESMAAQVLRERGVSAVGVRAKLAPPPPRSEQGRNYV
jgi:ATP-dependent Clp protease ATP-binding subunit ClpA